MLLRCGQSICMYETVWAACRAVIFGCIVIAVGLAMTVLGYFDKQFSERIEVVDGTVNVYHDRVVQYQLKSMQYLGPILMGIGSFILIIACVVTLESRDKHAQVITEESMSFKRRRLMSIEERAELSMNEVAPGENSPAALEESDNQTTLNQFSISTLAEVHRPRLAHTAPLADIDSLDLHSCSSQVTTERETTAVNSETRENLGYP
ncbi:hypothetical protein Y032_0086g1918 [Ancylostoma ceylanicum]|uniref:Uncharacterized protein n=2 Tax=Ancylostoma ceylanicum TaxID=53326 RepID=A0A016TPH4_9BILA|nr:hypothetical protein Y032_0086g1918 [Ancylostoma ceylanicum]